MNFSQRMQPALWQQLLNTLIARLAELAKEAPELLEYLKKHYEILKEIPLLKGASYELKAGGGYQRIFSEGYEQLNVSIYPDQHIAFQKAILEVGLKKESLYLPAGTGIDSSLYGLAVHDAPAPNQVPPFNLTPFDQFFIPILVGDAVYGVLHIWTTPMESMQAQLTVQLLVQVCAAIQVYLKARRAHDISAEIVRLHGYANFLENFSGSLELESVAHNLVDYIKTVSRCDRTILYLADNYKQAIDEKFNLYSTAFDYKPYAAAGFQIPNFESQEGTILHQTSKNLLLSTVEQMEKDNLANLPEGTDISTIKENTHALIRMPSPGQRKPIQLKWLERQTPHQDEQLQQYWGWAPMNWATVIPLLDSHFQICGYLFLEGKANPSLSSEILLKLIDLPYAAGQVVSTTLFWDGRRSLILARKLELLKDKYLNTPKKQRLFWILGPLFLLLFILLFPTQFFIKADAQVRPVQIRQIPAETMARIVRINVQEGDSVEKNQILMQLDTHDLELALNQYESEYLRALAEADKAQGIRDELGMQMAKLNARKADAQIENMNYQLERATVRAPFPGIVIGPKNLHDKEGMLVQTGEMLIELAKPDEWEVKAKLSEQDLVYLSNLLKKRGHVNAKLKLQSDPSKTYELILNEPSQLEYGLEADVLKGQYWFSAVLPLHVDPKTQKVLKAGFGGKLAFYVGYRPLSYVLLRNAFLYMRVNWF